LLITSIKEKKMKRIYGFMISGTIILAMLLAGCASAPPAAGQPAAPQAAATAPQPAATAKSLSGVPAFVNEAYLNASEDVLIGIGTYKIGNDMSKVGTGKTFAETRARADLSRQLTTMVKDMVTDYTATSETDPSVAISFQETVTQTLSKSDLKGAKTVKMETDGSTGLLWVVMEYSKSAAVQEVNQAANAAKLAIPAAAAFDALSRMDTAFGKDAGGGPIPVGE
jgi:PBP1b-binding outer membrane lipoprotein LpoB